MKSYRITKTHMDTYSSVPVGMSATGDLSIYTEEDGMKTSDLSGVKVGIRLAVFSSFFNFISTSDITEIVESSDDSVVFKTKTSTYRLEVI